ncbi:hypothetical protein A3I42_02395 [Candidatus Uhrbacteria bacterium RIFCSPLOWO2_02_FULL_49_11]|uniref:Uncharacterized protein n=1 Tax=Candidatus Uhrbacteria bacterium RIFCSPLOWO2_02_FULL_49_11 TaxID=1802409 RepID=A0A1F7VF14_9BACT|nr:MAG: hypothetical protein A3I42_02395 [Candidatus Uhrbacteria bacterium RIFCSPLOWO2_02_FULL_49_11]
MANPYPKSNDSPSEADDVEALKEKVRLFEESYIEFSRRLDELKRHVRELNTSVTEEIDHAKIRKLLTHIKTLTHS